MTSQQIQLTAKDDSLRPASLRDLEKLQRIPSHRRPQKCRTSMQLRLKDRVDGGHFQHFDLSHRAKSADRLWPSLAAPRWSYRSMIFTEGVSYTCLLRPLLPV